MTSTSRRLRAGALSLAVLLALAACSTAPRRPPPPLPETWFSIGDDGGPLDERALAGWWSLFGDPELDLWIESAVQRNHDARLALANARAARAGLREARAGLFPRLDLPGQAGRQWIDLPDDVGEIDGLDLGRLRLDTWELALEASWEVDLFGATRARGGAAERQYAGAQAEAVAARIAVASNVAQTYVQLRGLQRQSALLAEALEVARRTEYIAGRRFDIGELTRLDVEATAGERASVEAQLEESRAAEQETGFVLDTLAAAMPGTAAARLAAPAEVPVHAGAIPGGQPLDLLRRRPDVIAAAAQLQAGELNALAARRDLFPKIGLAAAAGRSGLALGDISSATDIRRIGLSLTFPWLDFGATRAAIDAADAEADGAYILLEQALATALEEVETANARVRGEQRRLRALDERAERAASALAMAQRAYELGELGLAEVLDAQAARLDADAQRVQARMALTTAQIALFTALGGGWHPGAGEDGGVEAVRRALPEGEADSQLPRGDSPRG